MRRGDLRIQEMYKEGEKKEEEEKMKNYLTTRNAKIQQNKTKQSGKMRNKIQQLPLENLRKMFREDMKNCEDIWTGRKKGSHKHNVFQDVVRRDELLHRRSHESVFTKDQKLMLEDESRNRWMTRWACSERPSPWPTRVGCGTPCAAECIGGAP